MKYVIESKDPDSSVQLRPLVDFRDNSESLCVIRVDGECSYSIPMELGERWLSPSVTVSIHEKSR